MIAFAKQVVARLEALGTYALAPLIRVDIVIDANGNLRVMEVESFEASTEYASIRHLLDGQVMGGGTPETNMAFADFLDEYWFDKLKQLLLMVLLSTDGDIAMIPILESIIFEK